MKPQSANPRQHQQASINCETEMLDAHGVRPTPNRMLVLRALMQTTCPVSVTEFESLLPTLDRSSIFRVLSLFAAKGLVHVIESGDGMQHYELCHGNGHCTPSDRHIHFYCTGCRRTFCFEKTPVPPVSLPEGFSAESAELLVKGLCPACSRLQESQKE